ncbi:hypothetical protein L5515_007374 [Caenorhabditis briggsae]|uniref:Carboxylesterase type B domain-containing protein n=1 Tax=Caenorhabditis briggsae TaxID=6238 RepID=A0AAE9JL35_CAEBR|nr:hypothetical protein L5515_007374 [Caenorhabditis briggsae]
MYSGTVYLILSIFLPPLYYIIITPNGLPVFVHIHGGAFEMGYSGYINDYSLSGTIQLRDVVFLSDYMFNKASLQTAKSCTTNGNNVYLASFDYLNTEGDIDPQSAALPFRASTHGSDHPYVFGDAIMTPFNPTEEQLKVMDMMGQFVANFVKYGNFGQFVDETYGLDVTDYYEDVKKNLTNFYLGNVSPLDRNATNKQVCDKFLHLHTRHSVRTLCYNRS